MRSPRGGESSSSRGGRTVGESSPRDRETEEARRQRTLLRVQARHARKTELRAERAALHTQRRDARAAMMEAEAEAARESVQYPVIDLLYLDPDDHGGEYNTRLIVNRILSRYIGGEIGRLETYLELKEYENLAGHAVTLYKMLRGLLCDELNSSTQLVIQNAVESITGGETGEPSLVVIADRVRLMKVDAELGCFRLANDLLIGCDTTPIFRLLALNPAPEDLVDSVFTAIGI